MDTFIKCMESRKVHGCPIEYRLNEKKKRKVFFFNFVFIFEAKICLILEPSISSEQILLFSILESQGGYFGFQVTGMIKWGQKSKSKKIPRVSNKTPKNPWTKI